MNVKLFIPKKYKKNDYQVFAISNKVYMVKNERIQSMEINKKIDS